jgi:hypothetical protein
VVRSGQVRCCRPIVCLWDSNSGEQAGCCHRLTGSVVGLHSKFLTLAQPLLLRCVRRHGSEAADPPAGPAAQARARNPRSSSPSPSPICRGSGMGSHSRFAGDRGSIPITIPDLPKSGIQLSTIEYCKGVEFRLPQFFTGLKVNCQCTANQAY